MFPKWKRRTAMLIFVMMVVVTFAMNDHDNDAIQIVGSQESFTLSQVASGQRCDPGQHLEQFTQTPERCAELVIAESSCDSNFFSWDDKFTRNCWCVKPGTDCLNSLKANAVVSTYKITGSTLTPNNLNGQGPNKGEGTRYMQFSNVASLYGQPIHLRLTTNDASDKLPGINRNELLGEFVTYTGPKLHNPYENNKSYTKMANVDVIRKDCIMANELKNQKGDQTNHSSIFSTSTRDDYNYVPVDSSSNCIKYYGYFKDEETVTHDNLLSYMPSTNTSNAQISYMSSLNTSNYQNMSTENN